MSDIGQAVTKRIFKGERHSCCTRGDYQSTKWPRGKL